MHDSTRYAINLTDRINTFVLQMRFYICIYNKFEFIKKNVQLNKISLQEMIEIAKFATDFVELFVKNTYTTFSCEVRRSFQWLFCMNRWLDILSNIWKVIHNQLMWHHIVK